MGRDESEQPYSPEFGRSWATESGPTTHRSWTFTAYQAAASRTAVYPGQGGFIGRTYAALGLNGEAGETGEQIKKMWRDDAADIEVRVLEVLDALEEEIVAMLPAHADYPISALFTAAAQNIKGAFNAPMTAERVEKIRKELGDTLWYAAQLATEIGADLGDVARENIEKLAARKAANLIHGEGSDR